MQKQKITLVQSAMFAGVSLVALCHFASPLLGHYSAGLVSHVVQTFAFLPMPLGPEGEVEEIIGPPSTASQMSVQSTSARSASSASASAPTASQPYRFALCNWGNGHYECVNTHPGVCGNYTQEGNFPTFEECYRNKLWHEDRYPWVYLCQDRNTGIYHCAMQCNPQIETQVPHMRFGTQAGCVGNGSWMYLCRDRRQGTFSCATTCNAQIETTVQGIRFQDQEPCHLEAMNRTNAAWYMCSQNGGLSFCQQGGCGSATGGRGSYDSQEACSAMKPPVYFVCRHVQSNQVACQSGGCAADEEVPENVDARGTENLLSCEAAANQLNGTTPTGTEIPADTCNWGWFCDWFGQDTTEQKGQAESDGNEGTPTETTTTGDPTSPPPCDLNHINDLHNLSLYWFQPCYTAPAETSTAQGRYGVCELRQWEPIMRRCINLGANPAETCHATSETRVPLMAPYPSERFCWTVATAYNAQNNRRPLAPRPGDSHTIER